MIKKAFTLIELLVVVAIIGLLASVVVVSVSGARKKAQDAKIKNDIQSVLSAAELHLASDKDGTFKGAAKACTASPPIAVPCKPIGLSVVESFKDEAGAKIMQQAPESPVGAYTWQVDATGTKYIVCGILSNGDPFVAQNGATFEVKTSPLACPTTP